MTTQKPLPGNKNNLNPKSIGELQECLYAWQRYNFGDQDNELCLVGICEESGELCHSILKLEQGIRGSAEKHLAEMRDAIGDIMIYTLNYLSGLDLKVQQWSHPTVKETDDITAVRKTIISVFRSAGKLTADPKNGQLISQMIYVLNHLCAIQGWNLEGILRETWAHVGKRDFKKYPGTGHPPEANKAQVPTVQDPVKSPQQPAGQPL